MKPLYRSITFWSGILVMIFIAWAWRDSMKAQSSLRRHNFNAQNLWGSISVEKTPLFYRGDASRFPLDRSGGFSVFSDTPAFPPPLILRGGGEESAYEVPELGIYHEWIKQRFRYLPQDSWIVLLPHWLLLALVALPWSGLLLWRSRRLHRTQAIAAS